MNPLETATAYAKLRDQFNLTLEDIGARVGGKSVSAVSNTLRLLKLPAAVKQVVATGELSEGQARPLIGASDATVKHLLPLIMKEQWSARKIEEFVANERPVEAKGRKTAIVRPQQHPALSKRLDAKVTTQQNAKGAGRIVIEFKSAEERERIEKQLGS